MEDFAMRAAMNIGHDLHEGHIPGCDNGKLSLADSPAAREHIATIIRNTDAAGRIVEAQHWWDAQRVRQPFVSVGAQSRQWAVEVVIDQRRIGGNGKTFTEAVEMCRSHVVALGKPELP